MKNLLRTIILFCSVGFISVNSAFSQASAKHIPTIVDAKIEYKGHEVSNERVVFSYNLPFAGMMEVRLFNENDDIIWREQYINDTGDNQFRLKATAFEKGKKYKMKFNYKTDEVEDLVVIR